MKHRGLSDSTVDLDLARLRAYRGLVEQYHRTLDLVSDAALARFPELIEEAAAYARAIDEVGVPGHVLDVGSGVGLPGIVVAAALPRRSVLLVERRRRRATFLRLAVAHLGLENAFVAESDVREVQIPGMVPAPQVQSGQRLPELGHVSVVTAQAVAPLAEIYCLTRHLHADRVLIVARKGPLWKAEADALSGRIGTAPAVRAAWPLADSGTLVAIEVPGGHPCPPSG